MLGADHHVSKLARQRGVERRSFVDREGQHVGWHGPAAVTRVELGDVVICPDRAGDVREAIVHGVLHLVGFDHETDAGEMLALQRRLLAQQSE